MTDLRKPVTQEEHYEAAKIRSGFEGLSSSCINILKTTEATHTRVLERDFRERLLPIVRACVLGDRTNQEAWVALAGGLYRPIYILDNEDRNKILMRLPPIMSDIPLPKPIQLEHGRHLDAKDILAKSDVAISNGETRLANQLDNQLVELFSPDQASDERNKNLIGLLIIWTHYKMDVKELLGEHTEEILALIQKEVPDEQNSTTSAAPQYPDEEDQPLSF